MARLQVTGASLLPWFPRTLEGEGYCANLRQRMVPRYRRASTFGTAANALGVRLKIDVLRTDPMREVIHIGLSGTVGVA